MASTPTQPRLIRHHDYKSWTSTWRDDSGRKRTARFGRESDLSRREALAAFEHWYQTQWQRFEHVRNPHQDGGPMTVVRLCAKYFRHAGMIYMKHGRRTSTIDTVRYALRSLRDAHATLPADELSNPKLATLRDAMIHSTAADGSDRVLAVSTVNDRLQVIKSAYRWGREKGLISAATLSDILAVARLRVGRCDAKPRGKVRAIDRSVVNDTVKYLPLVLQKLVETMWLTGMRPGEVCMMRPCDIDTTGKIWVYTPVEHKTEHVENSSRRICIGPKAQVFIRELLTRDLQAYLFSPREAHEERLAAKRAGRKTPWYPSSRQLVENPTSRFRECYTPATLRRAVKYACKKASIAAWNPNQIRHSFATRVFKSMTLEEASKTMGHLDIDTTLIYAEKDIEIAKGVARRLG